MRDDKDKTHGSLRCTQETVTTNLSSNSRAMAEDQVTKPDVNSTL